LELTAHQDNDDDYDPEREERSASPEGPEAEEVAQELVDLEEQDAFTEVVDAKGRSLGMVRVGGNDISNEPAKTTDEAIIDELKNLDKFKENSARLAVRMALTWERAVSNPCRLCVEALKLIHTLLGYGRGSEGRQLHQCFRVSKR
jgi:hypothetical protein